MKKLLILFLVLGVGVQVGRMIEGVSKTAAAGGGHGGGVAECASKNGDVNADGMVDLSDAVTILGNLFLGKPTELVGLCVPSELEACQTELATTQAALALCQAALAAKPTGLPDTGQTKCYNGLGQGLNCNSVIPLPCLGGQDGYYRTGCPSAGR